MAKKGTLWFKAECKTSDGKTIACSAYLSNGGVVLERVTAERGIETLRLHLGIKTVQHAKIEMAKWCGVPYESVKDVP